jgi:hypothetical protein
MLSLVRTILEVAVGLAVVLVVVGLIMGALRITRRLAGLSEQEPDDLPPEQPRERHELAAFLETPQGQARLAYNQGAAIFQFDLPLSEARYGGILGAVESEGWRLEHVNYLPAQTKAASGLVGIYIFRRAEPDWHKEPAVTEHDRADNPPAALTAPAPVVPALSLQSLPPVSPPTFEATDALAASPLRPSTQTE